MLNKSDRKLLILNAIDTLIEKRISQDHEYFKKGENVSVRKLADGNYIYQNQIVIEPKYLIDVPKRKKYVCYIRWESTCNVAHIEDMIMVDDFVMHKDQGLDFRGEVIEVNPIDDTITIRDEKMMEYTQKRSNFFVMSPFGDYIYREFVLISDNEQTFEDDKKYTVEIIELGERKFAKI